MPSTAIQNALGAQLPGILGDVGMPGIARYAILGLSAMGVADEIVNTAFALVCGAVAVALSFGLGGLKAAGRQMEYWLARLHQDKRN